jgi:hypothetical protein
MSFMILRKRSLESRFREQRDGPQAQVELTGQEKDQHGEKQQEFAGGRRHESDHRQHDVGSGYAGRRRLAEQRGLKLVCCRERLFEDGELFLDARPDLRRAADPLAHRPGHRGDRQTKRSDGEEDDQERRDPR